MKACGLFFEVYDGKALVLSGPVERTDVLTRKVQVFSTTYIDNFWSAAIMLPQKAMKRRSQVKDCWVHPAFSQLLAYQVTTSAVIWGVI